MIGFDPMTFGLWAQHASSAPHCYLPKPEIEPVSRRDSDYNNHYTHRINLIQWFEPRAPGSNLLGYMIITTTPFIINKGMYITEVIGFAGNWTRIAGFKVQSVNHYTTMQIISPIGIEPMTNRFLLYQYYTTTVCRSNIWAKAKWYIIIYIYMLIYYF